MQGSLEFDIIVQVISLDLFSSYKILLVKLEFSQGPFADFQHSVGTIQQPPICQRGKIRGKGEFMNQYSSTCADCGVEGLHYFLIFNISLHLMEHILYFSYKNFIASLGHVEKPACDCFAWDIQIFKLPFILLFACVSFHLYSPRFQLTKKFLIQLSKSDFESSWKCSLFFLLLSSSSINFKLSFHSLTWQN